MADTNCPLAKVADGTFKSYTFYQDENYRAVLDVAPINPGHALVIPKFPAETLDELTDDQAAALGIVLSKVSRGMKQQFGCGYRIWSSNGADAYQQVKWLHFHILPTPEDDRLSSNGKSLVVTDADNAYNFKRGKLNEDAAKICEGLAKLMED